MPQAIPAIATIILGAVGASAVVQIGVLILLNIGLSALSRSLAGKSRRNRETAPREVTVRGTVEPRQLIYGQTRAPGFLAFYGARGDRLYFVVAYAGHQVEEISDCWLDATRVPDADIDSVTGEVSTAAYVSNGVPKLYIWKHLGTHNQAADSVLTDAWGALWDSTHKGSGIAYVVYALDRDETIYPSGAPTNFFALVKGRKLYDPRLDSTNGGSGSHRADDATTWAWSSNWALAVRDYVSGGSIYYSTAVPDKRLAVGELDTRINDTYTIAAANIADEEVVIPGDSASTQKRYTCDTQLSCGDTHSENLSVLLSAGLGHLSYSGGQYRIFAGAYDAPTVTLDEDDIQGPVDVSTHPPTEDTYNLVSGTFYDEGRQWQEIPFPSRVNGNYEVDDGEQKTRNIELYATRTSYRCQRIAETILKQSRNKISVKFNRLSPKAMNIAIWETFMVNISEYGWEDKVFRCVDWEFLPDGFVSISAREEDPAAYANLEVDDYAEPGAAVSPQPEIESPAAPSNFTAVGTSNGIQFSWTMPTTGRLNSRVELYEHTASTPFSSATLIWDGNASGKFITKTDSTQRYYWIRLVSPDGKPSDVVPATTGLPGKASVVATQLSAFATPSSLAVSDDDLSGSETTASTTVTASGGTAPYTYAWTFASGGTDISINSASSATTTFTGTGLTTGETLSGTARCTVTDNVAATYTVDVTVVISRPNTAITASASPTSAFGYQLGSGPTVVTTSNSITCTGAPGGGTFSWRRVSGDSAVTAVSGTSATTKFRATVGIYQQKEAYFVCDYTQGGNTGTTNQVYILLQCEGPG